MELDAWQRDGRAFTYRGHEVFYRDAGDGPALLCIHGFPSASWDWHKLWPELTARFRVVALVLLLGQLVLDQRRLEHSPLPSPALRAYHTR